MARDDREKNKTIRKLRGQVRQLRKELRLAQSEISLLHTLWEKDVIDMAKNKRREDINKKRHPLCPECGNPTLDVTMVGIWKLMRCNACDFFNREQQEEEEHN